MSAHADRPVLAVTVASAAWALSPLLGGAAIAMALCDRQLMSKERGFDTKVEMHGAARHLLMRGERAPPFDGHLWAAGRPSRARRALYIFYLRGGAAALSTSCRGHARGFSCGGRGPERIHQTARRLGLRAVGDLRPRDPFSPVTNKISFATQPLAEFYFDA